MVTVYRSSEDEQAARQKLYEYNRLLYGAVLDLLSVLRASDDPVGARADTQMSEPARLRRRAAEIERQDGIIRRAREIVDKTRDAKGLAGRLPSEGVEVT